MNGRLVGLEPHFLFSANELCQSFVLSQFKCQQHEKASSQVIFFYSANLQKYPITHHLNHPLLCDLVWTSLEFCFDWDFVTFLSFQ